MIVRDELLEELKQTAGYARCEKAKQFVEAGKVIITKTAYENRDNFSIHAKVKGNQADYQTYIEVKNGEIEYLSCTCPDYESTYGTCKHILATVLEFNSNVGYIRKNENKSQLIKNNEKYRIYRQMINSFYSEEQKEINKKLPENEKVRLESKLIYKEDIKSFRLEVKIGNKQMYKIKDLPTFYTRMINNEIYKYGSKLEFAHIRENFENSSLPLLDYILKYAEIIKYTNEAEERYYTHALDRAYIAVSNSGLDELFNIYVNRKIDILSEYSTESTEFVDNVPNISFKLSDKNANEYKITTNINVFDYTIIEGKEYIYFWQKNKICRCPKEYESSILKLLNIFKINLTKEIVLRKEEFADFYSLVMPLLKGNIDIQEVDQEELKNYLPKKLHVKVFLDYNNKNYITADLKFKYDDVEFSPFIEVDTKMPRNAVEESKALDLFKNSGFMYDQKNNRLVLVRDEDIFNFLEKDIEKYISKFEVLATERFKNRQIIKPKINSVGIKLENNLLSIDLSNIDIDKSEISEIMKKYKLKKKFHRLKNGEFINLEENDTLNLIDKISDGTNLKYEDLVSTELKLPVYRGMYLDKILKENKDLVVKQNEEYRGLIDSVYSRQISDKFKLPMGLKATLREYQQVGFNWLKTLDEYGLGGILADDMGLGKTIQLLALIMSYVENTKNE